MSSRYGAVSMPVGDLRNRMIYEYRRTELMVLVIGNAGRLIAKGQVFYP
jgi:hypothetical protein